MTVYWQIELDSLFMIFLGTVCGDVWKQGQLYESEGAVVWIGEQRLVKTLLYFFVTLLVVG